MLAQYGLVFGRSSHTIYVDMVAGLIRRSKPSIIAIKSWPTYCDSSDSSKMLESRYLSESLASVGRVNVQTPDEA